MKKLIPLISLFLLVGRLAIGQDTTTVEKSVKSQREIAVKKDSSRKSDNESKITPTAVGQLTRAQARKLKREKKRELALRNNQSDRLKTQLSYMYWGPVE